MRTDRDTIVANGREAHRSSTRSSCRKGPWLYTAKTKSGSRVTRNIEDTFSNIPHLIGKAVEDYARNGESFSVYGISRIMKGHLRSRREDI